jgi:hypothetical protein
MKVRVVTLAIVAALLVSATVSAHAVEKSRKVTTGHSNKISAGIPARQVVVSPYARAAEAQREAGISSRPGALPMQRQARGAQRRLPPSNTP